MNVCVEHGEREPKELEKEEQMSRGLNKVMLIGNLGADPEIKYAASGTAIANFNIATSENRKNQDGEWEETTEWHRVVMFGRQAETCKDYLRKGSKVYIEGRLRTRSWEDQSGQRRYMTEVNGNLMLMLDSRGQGGMDGPGPRDESKRPHNDPGRGQPDSFPEADDDLPF